MSISAVIRCHEDPKVLDCIESLRKNETDYEIVVALTTAAKKTGELLKGLDRVHVVSAPVGNLSASSNIGIAASQYDKVVLLDADLICEPEYLDILDADLDDHMLVKSNIQFESSSWADSMVADLRHYVHNSGVFYCPGAAFRTELADYIGGHFFNDEVWWTEDAEMNHRIQKAGLDFHFSPNAVVTHIPEPMLRDLRGAYKIGMGKFSQVMFAGRDTFEEAFGATLKRILSGESFANLLAIYKHTGRIDPCAYSLIWNLCYYSGYYKALVASTINKS